MTWRVAKSLLTLRGQINGMYPSRSKISDGTIGDAKHASRSSDHNPWIKDGKTGVVSAIDFTHDPKSGCDMYRIAEGMRVARDPRVKYVIANRQIFSSVQNPWQWRKYTGSNPHTTHVHISVHSEKKLYDNTEGWTLSGAVKPPAAAAAPGTTRRSVLRRGMQGADVKTVQAILGITADGRFGPKTETAVKKFQDKSGAGLASDGIVGPKTWTELDKVEQHHTGDKVGDVLED